MIAADQSAEKSHVEREIANATDAPARPHVLRVDFSERAATLLELAQKSADFEYEWNASMSVIIASMAVSSSSARRTRILRCRSPMADSFRKPQLLLEALIGRSFSSGPKPATMPKVHPHSLKGAIVSLAVMWRLPVLLARDPEDSLRILRFLANQLLHSDSGILQRHDRKPKRFASRKLYMLQGLPGVGPALANRLLVQFGSIEAVVAANEDTLTQVPGIGRKKARRIRDLVS